MMSKRASVALREESYEHVLMCLICRNIFDDGEHQPKFLPCHHTFCKDCLKEYIRQSGDEIECPSCRKIATIPIAGVAALQTNFYIKYIQSLVHGGASIHVSENGGHCTVHAQERIEFYCKQCNIPVCTTCAKQKASECKEKGQKPPCLHQNKVSLTSITEESHQKLDTAFARAYSTSEIKKKELDSTKIALANEKDEALKKIEATFEHQAHALNRRSTLLKNKVIAIYNEHIERILSDEEEISTAMTCLISLKDYHEDRISHGQFSQTESGISEIKEVAVNIKEHVRPIENHIVFEPNHGSERFSASVRDLGRVRCTRPMVPRTEPEGFASEEQSIIQSTQNVCSPRGSSTERPTVMGNDKLTNDMPNLRSTKDATESSSTKQNILMRNKAECKRPVSPLKFRLPSETTDEATKCHEMTPESSLSPGSDPGTPTADEADMSHLGAASTARHLAMGELAQRLPCSVLNSLGLADANANINAPSADFKPEGAVRPSHLANLRSDSKPFKQDMLKADKGYYHTVYTSYDEETLLRELQGNSTDFEPMTGDESNVLLDRAIAGSTIPELSS